MNHQPCPECRDHNRSVCLCDHVLCMVCEDRYEHADKVVACAVPGCPNDEICAHDFQCFELVHGLPFCNACRNSLDVGWRLLAVWFLAGRKAA